MCNERDRERLLELAYDAQAMSDEISRLDEMRGGGLVAHWLAMAAQGLRDEIERTEASAFVHDPLVKIANAINSESTQ